MKTKEPKIYIICGKAKTGKDSVAKIISENVNNCVTLSITESLKYYAKLITDWDGSEETKPRDLLQELGIELIKEQIDGKFLIRRIIEDIKILSYYKENIIISGVRLEEEIDEIKKTYDNVIVIKVTRPDFDNELTTKQKEHITENDLNEYIADYNIVNNGELEVLEKKVIDILKGEKYE